MSQRSLLLLMAATLISYACYVRAEQNPYARYLAAGFSVIDRWSLEDVPDQELFNAAMGAMVEVLHKHGDHHSEFVDADQEAAFREEYQQEFGGVGIRLRLLGEPPMPTVIGLPEPGTPAAQADIHLADRLEAVNGRSTAGLDLEKVTQLVRGPVGEKVTISLRRSDAASPHVVEIERAKIMVESILGDARGADGRWDFMLRDEQRIGYIRIIKFGDKTAEELESAVAKLAAAGLKGLILDVRDDAGGALDAAVAISDLFLRAGLTIVTTRDREAIVRDRFMSSGAGKYTESELPLVVLVDRNSASASEIVAACLQDHGRAKIVGERSYGKGTVQRLMRIESGRSLLKLTSATYWRPSLKKIHRMPGEDQSAEWGVSPDPGFEVALSDESYEMWRAFRLRRDLIGEGVEKQLVEDLILADGEIPVDFRDEALDKAIEYFESDAR